MTGRRLKRKRSRYSLGYYWPIGKYGKYPLNSEHRNRSRYQQIYYFVLFIAFNHCVFELGSHEKVLYRKEDVAREKTQFFQKTGCLGKKNIVVSKTGVLSPASVMLVWRLA